MARHPKSPHIFEAGRVTANGHHLEPANEPLTAADRELARQFAGPDDLTNWLSPTFRRYAKLEREQLQREGHIHG